MTSEERRSATGGSHIGGHAKLEHSIFAGRDLNLTVQGITTADLDRLAEYILAALSASPDVAIAGGPEDKTILVMDGEPRVVASREQGLALARRTAGNVEAYLAGLVMHRDFGPWDTRYVPLEATAARPVTPETWAGYIPVELQAICRRGEGPDQRIERVTIPDVASAVRDYPQFVLLGEPGAGKTTVLQRIALDAARVRLKNAAAPVPFFVRLGTYRGTLSPFDFLAAQWRARLGTDFGVALRAGSVFLLLDALNEMPRQDYGEQIAAWRAFARDWEGVRTIFTCRTLDYAPTLPLQQIEVSRLDDERVRAFLARYVPDRAEGLWEELARHEGDLLDLARNPFLLAVLAWRYADTGDLPPNRGRLLEGLVERLLRREEQRAHADWIDGEAQIEALSTLAWAFQERGEGTSMPVADALRVLPARVTARGREVRTDAETVLRLGCAATILEETLEAQVRFYHHLVQELFAARALLSHFEAGESLVHLWQAPWWAREMPEPEGRGEWDPLPPPPSTGWEETTITAAGLVSDPETLVKAVLAVNPVLAGRCLEEGGAAVSEAVRERVRKSLLEGMQDKRVHLRARIAAGHVLGRLGDPRFAVQERNGVRFILPPVVKVPGGSYKIGSGWWDGQAYKQERPRHEVALGLFAIGKYPVTVAEYRCFVQGGGYEEERYWETEAARAWLWGEETGGGAIESILETRQRLLDSGRSVEYWAQELSWIPQDLEAWQQLTAMSEEEAREVLAPIYADRSRREPAFWDDRAYTGANQPVVGVTWYEARAYCAWLSEVAGRACRLPSEPEWEASVRGGKAGIYPWGHRFDLARANTVEGRVLRTTPVGVYPQGAGPLGLEDGAGNVWEWTTSLFESYPYRAGDGHEDPETAGRRVVRGGAWVDNRRYARCAVRLGAGPDYFVTSLGFRVVFPGSPSDF